MDIFDKVKYEMNAGRARSAIHLARKHGWKNHKGGIGLVGTGDDVEIILNREMLVANIQSILSDISIVRGHQVASLDDAVHVHIFEGRVMRLRAYVELYDQVAAIGGEMPVRLMASKDPTSVYPSLRTDPVEAVQ